jgi:uncharacterized membrane protein
VERVQNDEETMARLRESWRQANASVRMEGGIVDQETLDMQERHIRGEITKAEYRDWIQSSIRTR